MPYAPIFVVAVAIGFAATLLVRGLARRAGVVDRPDGFRKLQRGPVPLLGGIGIFAAFSGSLVIVSRVTGDSELASCMGSADTLYLLGGAAAVLLLGFADDLRHMKARWKVTGTLLISLAMYAVGYRIGGISNPFGRPIELGWLAVPVTVFWFMGCMNAINLIDGLDGLAAGVAFFASGSVLLTGVLFGNNGASMLAAALAGSSLGFLLLNFYPASIYLGDSGSLLLGFLLAAIGLRGAQKSQMVVALLIPITALGLPIIDTALAIMRRWLKAVPFVYSDRQHIHHKLQELGLSHRMAVLVMYGVCLVLAELALLMTAANSWQSAAVLFVLALLTFLGVRTIGRHEYELLKRKLGSYVERHRTRVRCRTAAFVASASMRNARTLEELWQLLVRAAEEIELDRLDLAMRARPRDNGNGIYFRWSRNGNGRPARDDVVWTAVVPLQVNGTQLGRLRVQKATNGTPLSADVPETLQLLGKAFAINAARVNGSGMPTGQQAHT